MGPTGNNSGANHGMKPSHIFNILHKYVCVDVLPENNGVLPPTLRGLLLRSSVNNKNITNITLAALSIIRQLVVSMALIGEERAHLTRF